jgi:hypothetical protein
MLSTSKLDLSQPPVRSKDNGNESFATKANLWHPAFIPGGVINGDVSEETEIDESVRILHVPDEVLERPAAAADEQLITEYVDSEKWCGDERTKYAVLKVEATSFVLGVICAALALVLVS